MARFVYRMQSVLNIKQKTEGQVKMEFAEAQAELNRQNDILNGYINRKEQYLLEAEELRKRGGDGGEYGATTHRPRRMGWFDCVATKYGCRIQGTTDVAFTVIDVLGYLDKIPVCTGYEYNGEIIKDFPTTQILEKLDGWKTDIRGIKNYDELPENCKKYIDFVEQQIGFPITMVSNGPSRDDIIYRESKLK